MKLFCGYLWIICENRVIEGRCIEGHWIEGHWIEVHFFFTVKYVLQFKKHYFSHFPVTERRTFKHIKNSRKQQIVLLYPKVLCYYVGRWPAPKTKRLSVLCY